MTELYFWRFRRRSPTGDEDVLGWLEAADSYPKYYDTENAYQVSIVMCEVPDDV